MYTKYMIYIYTIYVCISYKNASKGNEININLKLARARKYIVYKVMIC